MQNVQLTSTRLPVAPTAVLAECRLYGPNNHKRKPGSGPRKLAPLFDENIRYSWQMSNWRDICLTGNCHISPFEFGFCTARWLPRVEGIFPWKIHFLALPPPTFFARLGSDRRYYGGVPRGLCPITDGVVIIPGTNIGRPRVRKSRKRVSLRLSPHPKIPTLACANVLFMPKCQK